MDIQKGHADFLREARPEDKPGQFTGKVIGVSFSFSPLPADENELEYVLQLFGSKSPKVECYMNRNGDHILSVALSVFDPAAADVAVKNAQDRRDASARRMSLAEFQSMKSGKFIGPEHRFTAGVSPTGKERRGVAVPVAAAPANPAAAGWGQAPPPYVRKA
jgi:hypothetical protein